MLKKNQVILNFCLGIQVGFKMDGLYTEFVQSKLFETYQRFICKGLMCLDHGQKFGSTTLQTIDLNNMLFPSIHFVMLDVWTKELDGTWFLVFRDF